MALDEFGLIRRYFATTDIGFSVPGVALGGGDDCALLQLEPDEQLAISMDILQEGVHFPAGCEASELAQRALRVNLSDLAAMGAQPLCFTLGLSLSGVNEDWLEGFSQGLARVAEVFGCPLVGGDVTRGPLSICIQVHGRLPRGQALRRDTAAAGDLVYVTGTLGDAAAALPLVTGEGGATETTSEQRDHLLRAYYRPEPQVRAGMVLRGQASAAIDLSDGLASDLGHILTASDVGAEIELDRLPLSDVFRDIVPVGRQALLALQGGDDYQLCFTVPPARSARVEDSLAACGIRATRIGRLTAAENGIHWLNADGTENRQVTGGYRHFVT